MNWIVAGGVIAGAISVPIAYLNTVKELEVAMAGMNQVIDHKKLAEEAAAKGVDEHTYAQQRLNKELETFIDISATYGEKTENIIEAGKLWGRLYKDLGIVNALTAQSAKLAVADNFSLVEANRAAEAAMFQYGLTAHNTTEAIAYSGRIIDVWTKLAHTAGASAQDLTQGVERSGSVAKMVGADFEFLNASIATGVRSTGRSGTEIGNTLKTVFGSIHSKKAIDELDKLGVATYKYSEDGKKQFRDVQDVLLDLMVATQGTSANLEDLFKSASGGKFQWAKASAMFGDYKEFIRAWGEAVNATGFTEKQIEMQMDTIARKIETLKADMQGLVMNTANAGLTKFIKNQLDTLDNILVMFKKIPVEGWQTVKVITEVAIAIGLVTKAVRAMNIEMALSKRTWIGLSLTAIASIITMVLDNMGELENATRKQQQAMQDEVAVANQELESMQQRARFADSLMSAHAKLQAQMNDTALSSEKQKQAQENLKATEEQLTIVLGNAAVERIRQAGWTMEAYDKEKNAFLKSIEEKKIAMFKHQADRINDLTWTIDTYYKGLTEAYYADADAYISSTKSKIAALSAWEQFQADNSKKEVAHKREMLRNNLSRMDELKTDIDENGEQQRGYSTNVEQYERLKAQNEELVRGVNDNIDYINNIVKTSDYITRINEAQSKAKEERANLTSTAMGINFHPEGAGGSDAYESEDNKKTKTKRDPNADYTYDSAPVASYNDLAWQGAIDRIGIPYELGGNGVDSTDCGKLILDAYASAGVDFANRYVPSMIQEAVDKGAWHPYGDGYTPQKGDAAVVLGDNHVVMSDGSGGYIGASTGQGAVIQSNNLEGSFGTPTGYISVAELTGGATPSRINVSTLDQQQSIYRKMLKDNDFTSAKLSADRYEDALKSLSLQQDIFGKTSDISASKQRTLTERMAELHNEGAVYEKRIDALTASIDSVIEHNNPLQNSLGVTQEQWNALDKAGKRALRTQRKDILDNNKAVKDMNATLNDYTAKLSETQGKIAEIQNEILKEGYSGVFDSSKIHERNMQAIENKAKLAEYAMEDYGGIYYNQRMYQLQYAEALEKSNELERRRIELLKELEDLQEEAKNRVPTINALIEAQNSKMSKLTEGTQEYVDALKELKRLEETRDLARQGISAGTIAKQEEVDKITLDGKSTKKTLDETKDAFQDVRKTAADTFADIIVEGNSAKDVWKNLWKDMAKDAIRRLFQVQDSVKQTSFLMQALGGLFGLGGASTGAFDAMGGYTSVTGFFASGGSIPGYATGGNTDGLIKGAGTGTSDSILTYLQHRGQFIKTSKGEYIMQKSAVDKYGTTMLDMINAGKFANGGKIGTDVVPYLKNPKVVQDNTSLLSADAKINREMSKQLATQNELMQQQNSMLSNMGGGNGNIVVMPVQPDANSVLKILQDNPRAVQAILGGQRKMGFR